MPAFKVGQTVQRVEASYKCSPTKIINQITLDYIEDKMNQGYTYILVEPPKEQDDLNFDLPDVSNGIRLHQKERPQDCESCSS